MAAQGVGLNPGTTPTTPGVVNYQQPAPPETPASTATAGVPGTADASQIIANVHSLAHGGGDTFQKTGAPPSSDAQPSPQEQLADEALAYAAGLATGDTVEIGGKKK